MFQQLFSQYKTSPTSAEQMAGNRSYHVPYKHLIVNLC